MCISLFHPFHPFLSSCCDSCFFNLVYWIFWILSVCLWLEAMVVTHALLAKRKAIRGTSPWVLCCTDNTLNSLHRLRTWILECYLHYPLQQLHKNKRLADPNPERYDIPMLCPVPRCEELDMADSRRSKEREPWLRMASHSCAECAHQSWESPRAQHKVDEICAAWRAAKNLHGPRRYLSASGNPDLKSIQFWYSFRIPHHAVSCCV